MPWYVGLVIAASRCASFLDDFERADSSDLGSDWITPASLPSGGAGFFDLTGIDTAHDFTLVSGEAVGYLDNVSGRQSAINLWADPMSGDDQFIEATFTLGPTIGGSDVNVLYFYLGLDDSDFTGYGLEVIQNSTGFRQRFYHWTAGVGDGDSFDYLYVFGSHTVTIRFELSAAGVASAYVNGSLENTYDWPGEGYTFAAAGSMIGMSARYAPVGGGGGVTTIESFEGGCV